MKSAEIRFYAELKDFLPRHHRTSGIVTHEFVVAGSVKDAIEGYGVPHTEVDLVVVNGESVGFEYRVEPGDRVGVYPMFETFDISPVVRLRPEPLRDVRFVVDGHLGKLARFLRLLGFDTLVDQTWTDEDLVRISVAERRVLVRNARE